MAITIVNNTDANYKTGSNTSTWSDTSYQIIPTDRVWGSQGIELLNPLYLNDPFGFGDKAKIDLINCLSNLNKHKAHFIFGSGDPNEELNKHFSTSHASFDTGDDLWWGYKHRIDDYEEGFHYNHAGAGAELGQILLNGDGDIYEKDDVTITDLALNRASNFGITDTNYKNIYYIDLQYINNSLKGGLLTIYRITDKGTATKEIPHANNLYTYPDVKDVQSANHIDWLGRAITDSDWLSPLYFNKTPLESNENQIESNESVIIYKEPVWEIDPDFQFYIKNLSILNDTDTGGSSTITGETTKLLFEDENGQKCILYANTLIAEQIDVTTLNQMQVYDNDMLVNSEDVETGDGRYSINRISEDNVSLKYTKNIDRFELKDESDNLLKLNCAKVMINGLSEFEYDADVVIRTQVEFDAVFDGTVIDAVFPYKKFRIDPGVYTLSNDIDIQTDNVNITCIKGASISMNSGYNIKNSSASDINNLHLEVYLTDSTGTTNIVDLTNIIQSKVILQVKDISGVNVINGGSNNKIDLAIGDGVSMSNNLFEVDNSYITGRLLTDATGDKLFNNCNNLILMCYIDGQSIMGTNNYDF